jgi:hypothetical protein
MDFGAGVTVESVRVLSAKRTTVVVSVAADAVPGPRSVTLTNPDGGQTTVPGAFTVAPPPSITAADPSGLPVGAIAQPVMITGSGFEPGLVVDLGAGVTVGVVTVVDAGTLTATVTVASDASPGARDLRITNPDGSSATLAGGFTIT